jgi:hypothetical protein
MIPPANRLIGLSVGLSISLIVESLAWASANGEKPAEGERCRGPLPEHADNVVAFQICKRQQRATLGEGITAQLINLNAEVGIWYLLKLNVRGKRYVEHLEVPPASDINLSLDKTGLVLIGRESSTSCSLLDKDDQPIPELIEEVPRHKKAPAFVELCEGKIFRRRIVSPEGESLTSAVANSLRRQNGITQQVLRLVKSMPGVVSRDEKAALLRGTRPQRHDAAEPASAPLTPDSENLFTSVASTRMTVGVQADGEGLYLGRWYKARGRKGVFVNVMTLASLSDESNLPPTTRDVLNYLVAFDLGLHEIAYAIGARDPIPGWALAGFGAAGSRLPYALSEATSQVGGPSGFNSSDPLVPLGLVPPYDAGRIVATFNAGFLRFDSLMSDGPLFRVNHFSHYGYVQAGVSFSKLQPGLATLVSFVDGRTDLMTWPEDDSSLLHRVVYARQNGVALVENGALGKFVYEYGNWGGTTNPGDNVPASRSAVCLQEVSGRRFLVVAFFPRIHVPPMAVALKSYGCAYAMQLDVNTPRSGSVSLFTRSGDRIHVGDLFAWDERSAQITADERLETNKRNDFFYVLKREQRLP